MGLISLKQFNRAIVDPLFSWRVDLSPRLHYGPLQGDVAKKKFKILIIELGPIWRFS